MAKNCLFAESEIDLKPLLREGNIEKLQHALRKIVFEKPGKHIISQTEPSHKPFDMSRVGG
jgi:cyclic pyranopterin phosphate synthase